MNIRRDERGLMTLWLLCLMACGPSIDPPETDICGALEESSLPAVGGIYGSAIVGDTLYALGFRGLEIYELAGDTPARVAILPIDVEPSYVSFLSVEDDLAVWFEQSTDEDFLQVVVADVSEPSQPELLSRTNVGPIGSVFWEYGARDGDRVAVFLEDRGGGVLLVDLADPSQPAWRVLSGGGDLEAARALELQGDTLYWLDATQGDGDPTFRVSSFELGESSDARLTSLELGPYPRRYGPYGDLRLVDDDTLAVVTATGLSTILHLLDVSEPSAPTSLGELALPSGSSEVLRLGSGGLLYSLSRNGETVHTIDASNPRSPALLSTHNMPVLDEEQPLLDSPAATAEGLRVAYPSLLMDWTIDPAEGRRIESERFDLDRRPEGVLDAAMYGELTYVLSPGWVDVIERGGRGGPTRSASFEVPSDVTRLTRGGSWLALHGEEGTSVLDLDDPLAPEAAGAVPYDLSGDDPWRETPLVFVIEGDALRLVFHDRVETWGLGGQANPERLDTTAIPGDEDYRSWTLIPWPTGFGLTASWGAAQALTFRFTDEGVELVHEWSLMFGSQLLPVDDGAVNLTEDGALWWSSPAGPPTDLAAAPTELILSNGEVWIDQDEASELRIWSPSLSDAPLWLVSTTGGQRLEDLHGQVAVAASYWGDLTWVGLACE